jgi:hypothetical protein
MCWTSKVIAESNSGERQIPIYKVLSRSLQYGTLEAYFRRTAYYLNQEYKEEIIPYHGDVHDFYMIHQGLHCYGSSCKFIKFGKSINVLNAKLDHYYPHSGGYESVVAVGYIPCNTTYYINDREEIVTTKLVLTRILDEKELIYN